MLELDGAVTTTFLSPDGSAHETRRNDTGRGAPPHHANPIAGRPYWFVFSAVRPAPSRHHPTLRIPPLIPTAATTEELLAGNSIQRSADKTTRPAAIAVYDQVIAEATISPISPSSAPHFTGRPVSRSSCRSTPTAAADQAVYLADSPEDPRSRRLMEGPRLRQQQQPRRRH